MLLIFKQIRVMHCRIRSMARKFHIYLEKEIIYSSAHEEIRLFNFYFELITSSSMNFMVAPCISNIKHFIVQLMHTDYKILKLLK